MIDLFDNTKYKVLYINLYTNENELQKRYKEKSKIRKGKWVNNLEIIKKIDIYLRKNGKINIENSKLNLTIERIEKYVKEILYL